VARKAGEALGSSDHWLLTPDSGARIAPSEISRKLDLAQTRFEEWIFGSRVLSSNGPAATLPVEIPLALDFWPRQTVIHLSPTLEEAFSIDDEAEGEKLERAVLSVVELLYPERAYRSPRIPEGTGTRELTDVLGFNDDWLCVIQAKALSVLGVADGRSSERRTSAVTKDITKGLKQLAGAMRKIRGSVPIYDAGGTPINIPDRNAPAHGIVLVSEMYSFVDWRAVAVASSDASEKAHMTLIHVFDLRELVSIANSSGATDRFNESLMQRWALVKKKGTAYVRARPRNAADPPPEEDWSQDK